jgi:NDP-sugar pyrophosphorylase family protein
MHFLCIKKDMNQALILAGGFGSRLMPIVNDRPKAMATIQGVPFLEILVTYLAKQGITDIIFALGYLSNYIQDYFGDGKKLGVTIRYSVENYPMGTAGAIKNATPLLASTFFVLNGDTFLETDYAPIDAYHQEKKADVTMVLTKNKKHEKRGMVRIDKTNKIVQYKENDTQNEDDFFYSNAGIYLMNRKILKYIKKDEKVSLEHEVFPRLYKALSLFGYIVDRQYIDIGTPEKYLKAQKILPAYVKE